MRINKKKIYIITNGCPRRDLDSGRLEHFFRANGCIIVKKPKFADYIIFVTCSFKKAKVEQCLKMISNLLKYRAELIIAGCLPDIAPNELRDAFKGRVVETRNLEKIGELFTDFKVKFNSIPDVNLVSQGILQKFFIYFEFNRRFFNRCFDFIVQKFKKNYKANIEKVKSNVVITKPAFLRISNGCIENCAYCTIYRAVGKLRSKKIDECLLEYSKLLKQGYRNFTFLADNLGVYGLDYGTTLEHLFQSLSDVDKELPVCWGLLDMHPRWVVKYKNILTKYIAEEKIKSIECAIQSGSDRILKLMNRHHSIAEIIEILKNFRSLQPKLHLSTQLIVGFPSETEKELAETVDAVRAIGFNEVSFYPYYDGYESISSKMNGKIPKEIIYSRLKKATDLLKKEGVICKCDEILI